MKKLNTATLLTDLNGLKGAAEALQQAANMIGDNKERLDAVENALQHLEKQVESLERRYSELLYTIGELRHQS